MVANGAVVSILQAIPRYDARWQTVGQSLTADTDRTFHFFARQFFAERELARRDGGAQWKCDVSFAVLIAMRFSWRSYCDYR